MNGWVAILGSTSVEDWGARIILLFAVLGIVWKILSGITDIKNRLDAIGPDGKHVERLVKELADVRAGLEKVLAMDLATGPELRILDGRLAQIELTLSNHTAQDAAHFADLHQELLTLRVRVEEIAHAAGIPIDDGNRTGSDR